MSPRSTTLPLYIWYRGSNSEFLRRHRSINDAKMNFSALIPCFIDHLFLASDFRQLPCWYFLQVSHYFATAAFASGIFIAWGIGMNLCTRLQWVIEFIPFCSDMILVMFVYCSAPSRLGLVLSSATTQAYLVLRFTILRWVLPPLFIGIVQGIAAGIGTSNFLGAAFVMSLKSSSTGSMKNIPLKCLALSSFGFSIAHFLFCFLFRCIRHMLSHIWQHIVRTRGCLFPCKSPSGPCISVRRSFLQLKKSCDACPCIR